jgi:hypothetical protein
MMEGLGRIRRLIKLRVVKDESGKDDVVCSCIEAKARASPASRHGKPALACIVCDERGEHCVTLLTSSSHERGTSSMLLHSAW